MFSDVIRFEQITGIKRAEAVGRRCCDVFRANICENACALKQTLATGRRVANKVVYIRAVRKKPSGKTTEEIL